MSEEIPDKEVLLPFEMQHIPKDYAPYYKSKRLSFFSNIEKFPELWSCYIQLDDIWLNELADLDAGISKEKLVPLILYMNAHAKIRVSIELGFSGCVAEARSILRDAIEFVAHSHRIVGDPTLQKVWIEKADNEELWMKEFWYEKKERLFKGLDELYGRWKALSESGSHANIVALVGRFKIIESGNRTDWRLHYCGGEDDRAWVLEMFTFLLTCCTMENTFFGDHQSRLVLDDRLGRKRTNFRNYKEELRQNLITRFSVQLPPDL